MEANGTAGGGGGEEEEVDRGEVWGGGVWGEKRRRVFIIKEKILIPPRRGP